MCFGMAASMGSFLLAAGTKGKRHWAGISHGKTVRKPWEKPWETLKNTRNIVENEMNIHEECLIFG